jgi:ADP-ribose pyrophosphatase YjhB (NUDIX family)
MIEKHIAASIIWIPDDDARGSVYILHERKTGNDNGEIGKKGLYGGEIEDKDESHAHAVSRELQEESGLLFEPQFFEPVSSFFVKSERDGEEILTEAEIFLLQTPYGLKPEQFKNGLPMTEKDISRAKALGELTSVAAMAFGKVKGI